MRAARAPCMEKIYGNARAPRGRPAPCIDFAAAKNTVYIIYNSALTTTSIVSAVYMHVHVLIADYYSIYWPALYDVADLDLWAVDLEPRPAAL